jgi:hypothetical protein
MSRLCGLGISQLEPVESCFKIIKDPDVHAPISGHFLSKPIRIKDWLFQHKRELRRGSARLGCISRHTACGKVAVVETLDNRGFTDDLAAIEEDFGDLVHRDRVNDFKKGLLGLCGSELAARNNAKESRLGSDFYQHADGARTRHFRCRSMYWRANSFR